MIIIFDDPSINRFSTCACDLHMCRMKGNATNNIDMSHKTRGIGGYAITTMNGIHYNEFVST